MFEMRVALAAIGAIVGAGFASGREIITFFTGQGKFWIAGALFCSAAAGALVALLCAMAQKTGAGSLSQIYARAMDEHCGEAVQVVYVLLLFVVSAAMLSAAGEIGAMAFSAGSARAFGVALALSMALWAAKSGRNLARAGFIAAAGIIVFYAILFLKNDAVPSWAQGSFFGAGALGTLYACMNAALSAGVVCTLAKDGVRAKRAGIYTGALLFALLSVACMAIGKMGNTSLALPSLALAGTFGPGVFAVGLVSMLIAIVTTLASTLHGARQILIEAGIGKNWAMLLALIGPALLSVVGFSPIVDIGYPLLGVLCAHLLPVLVIFLKD